LLDGALKEIRICPLLPLETPTIIGAFGLPAPPKP
jgi:hypothetical protein